MKLNLGCGNDIRQQGYINVDLKEATKLSPDIYRQGDVKNLDWMCEDGQVDEILALDVLGHLQNHQIGPTLQNWIKKLVPGGVLKISVIDIYTAAKCFTNGQIILQDFLCAMYGTQQNGDCRQSALDATMLVRTLQDNGLTIAEKKYSNIMFYVNATKAVN